mgnify:CR=1 FL=1
MKRKWLSVSIVSLILLCISFYKTYLETSSVIETSSSIHTTQSNTETFEVKETPYITERVEASYPTIIGGVSQKKLDKWNQIIKDDFDKILAIYSYDPFAGLDEIPDQANRIYLRIQYEIKLLNKQFLSILYRASYNSPYAAHPTELVYTTNIDTEKDRRLTLRDLVRLDSSFVSHLRSWEISEIAPINPMLNAVIRTILNDISDEELLDGLNTADQIGSSNRWGIFTYLTPSKLGVSVSVPHFAGDHVELEKAYEELKDYLNPDYQWDNP